MKRTLLFRNILAGLAACTLLASCGGASGGVTPTAPMAPTMAAGSPAAASPAATTAAPGDLATEQPAAQVTEKATEKATAKTTAATAETVPLGFFANPVLDQDFPDPDVLKVGDTYYAYATNTGQTNIQVAKSKDLVHWQMLGDALPKLPAWAVQDFGWAWAPEVSQPATGNGYIMYHVARFKIDQDGTQCIGTATSDKPEGPFQPVGDKPFICQVEEGGSIDMSLFTDEDGKRYALWKNDGNSGGGQTWIYLQPVSDDGLSLTGEPTRLITADQAWEGVLVEAPTLWKHAGKYYLFYSANAYNDTRYAVGYAMADQITGPYTKDLRPLLKTTIPAGIVGPGGQDIVVGPNGGEWILFHGWSGEAYRRMYLAPLKWEDDKPVVEIKSRDPISMP